MVAPPARQTWPSLALRWFVAAIIGLCLVANLHPHEAQALPCDDLSYSKDLNIIPVSQTRVVSDIHASSDHFECLTRVDCLLVLPNAPTQRAGLSDYDKRAAAKFKAFFVAALSLLQDQAHIEPTDILAPPKASQRALTMSLVLLPSVIMTV